MDLIIGLISEKSFADATVGPTLMCIIGEFLVFMKCRNIKNKQKYTQFVSLKRTDLNNENVLLLLLFISVDLHNPIDI